MSVNSEYKNFVDNFKPEFGNKEHIEVYALMEEIRKEIIALDKILEKKKAGIAIKKKLADLKKRAIYLFEKDRLNF